MRRLEPASTHGIATMAKVPHSRARPVFTPGVSRGVPNGHKAVPSEQARHSGRARLMRWKCRPPAGQTCPNRVMARPLTEEVQRTASGRAHPGYLYV